MSSKQIQYEFLILTMIIFIYSSYWLMKKKVDSLNMSEIKIKDPSSKVF